jgi:hypothetical protein
MLRLRITVSEEEKINTIKLVRWLLGELNPTNGEWLTSPWGLKESKDFVEDVPVVNRKRTFLFNTNNSLEKVQGYLRNDFRNSSIFVETCVNDTVRYGTVDGVTFTNEQIQHIADTYFGILTDNKVPPVEALKHVENLLIGLGVKGRPEVKWCSCMTVRSQRSDSAGISGCA